MDEAVVVGAEGRDRTGDTTIFSRVLYQLSYLGANPNLGAAIRCPQPRPQRSLHRRFASPGMVPAHDLSDNIRKFRLLPAGTNSCLCNRPFYVETERTFVIDYYV